jgi:hypothetical protein
MKAFAAAAKTYAFAATATAGKMGEAPLMGGVGIATGDAKAMLAAQRQIGRTQGHLMEALDADTMDTTMRSTVKQEASTVSGVSFDEIRQTMSVEQQDSPQAQMQKLFYGKDGLVARVGVRDAQTLILAQGLDDAELAKVLESAKSKSDAAMTAASNKVAQRLPPTRLAEAYLSVENSASAVSKFQEAMFGVKAAIQIPEGQAPIGAAISAPKGALQADVFVPSSVVQNLIGAAMQVYIGMMMPDTGDL